ncbi:hypothetical protein D3C86_1415030 [compost metagenome]
MQTTLILFPHIHFHIKHGRMLKDRIFRNMQAFIAKQHTALRIHLEFIMEYEHRIVDRIAGWIG